MPDLVHPIHKDTVEIKIKDRRYVFASKTLMLLLSMYFPALTGAGLHTIIESNPEFAVHIAKRHHLVPILDDAEH